MNNQCRLFIYLGFDLIPPWLVGQGAASWTCNQMVADLRAGLITNQLKKDENLD